MFATWWKCGHRLRTMKIVYRYVDGCFDWLISGQQSVNPWREAISILYGKYKRFTFVHPVDQYSTPTKFHCSWMTNSRVTVGQVP